ncbi:MAG: radical SAM protein [Symploca sp. SIO1B1]|nr:radical SAM protein [Symploca sp. SIO1B1]
MTTSTKAIEQHQYTQPRSARFHLFDDGAQKYLLDVESGRIHLLPAVHAKTLETALLLNEPTRAELTALALGMVSTTPNKAEPPKSVAIKALSLAVAQKCNLGCTYCYAQQGTFGGKAGNMSSEVAKASVDQLFQGAKPGEKLTLGFMGGEPLTNRETLHLSTRYAAQEAANRGIGIGFSMTTNATLLLDEDIDLFQEYGFTLTISIDGLQATNDQLRPFASGKGSFDQVAKNVSALLSVPRRSYKVFARVTVTPKNLDLPEIMTGLLAMGFDAVMFSPMLSAPTGQEEMQAADLDQLLEQLIECGEIFREELLQGQILPFSNLIKTLQSIHSYRRDQYPCGAGGGYMGVSAEGELYACHRFVNDDVGHMGNVSSGVELQKQTTWLNNRHLQNQSPCTSCWARYLCSGSCHYEVIKRGRPACDYIRGWLNYCLTIYTELLQNQPKTLGKILGNG